MSFALVAASLLAGVAIVGAAPATPIIPSGAPIVTPTPTPTPGFPGSLPPPPPFSIMAVNPPKALPKRATANDIRWQPSIDFDMDGCYNVPAIDASGYVVEGLPHEWVGLASDCRDASDLANNNVYSRQRCNDNGWCVYIYDYYFEKDVSLPYLPDPGHTHDWEHIAVWVQGGTTARYVGVSQHGEYEIRAASDLRWDGEHAKVVYHKDGVSTHCFRFANEKDDAIENHTGAWFRGDLISYNGFPTTELRSKLMSHDFGKASIAIKDSSFPGNIDRSRPDGVLFDSSKDASGSPGNP